MNSREGTPSNSSIERVETLQLLATRSPWPFAVAHRDAIARHWAERSAANPAFFDGEVFVLRELRTGAGGPEAVLSLERFSAFLYWRDGNGQADGTLDGFAAAVVRSAEGHVLVGRAAAGTLNAGHIYLPGGFLDARDLRADGTIDVVASAARELEEETGLAAREVSQVPGIIVARHGRHCCFAIEYRSALTSEELARRMREGLARDASRELTEIEVVRAADDLERVDMLGHASFVIRSVLEGTL